MKAPVRKMLVMYRVLSGKMAVTLSGNWIDARLVQPEKVPSSVVSPAGRSTVVSEEQYMKELLIVFRPSDSVALVRAVQLVKALGPNVVTESGRVTV